MYFKKIVGQYEFKILQNVKKINSPNLLSFHHFQKKNNLIIIYSIKKHPFRSLTIFQEKKCVTIIFRSIDLLRSQHILHMDVHCSNILTNNTKTNFYLIDYGISVKLSKHFEKTQNLNYFLFILNEDKFQLLWNFYFKTNIMITDFRILKKKLSNLSKKKYSLLLQKLYSSIFYSKLLDFEVIPFLDIFPYSEIKLTTKKQCMIMKLILNRVYFIYHLLFQKNIKNEIYMCFLY